MAVRKSSGSTLGISAWDRVECEQLSVQPAEDKGSVDVPKINAIFSNQSVNKLENQFERRAFNKIF